jgi:uncharacterized UPF0160 family protein
MSVQVATHNGPFHADDVMAFALIRTFFDASATIVRTRDPGRIDASDIVIDVGGVYAPERRRFDHHQASYTGPLSAAGMVLAWLTEDGHVSQALSARLRERLMDYVDAVDNGRVAPVAGVPCYPSLVDALNQPASTQKEFDQAFLVAHAIAAAWVCGIQAEHDRIQAAETRIPQAMKEAEAENRNVLFLSEYLRWKPVYFRHGGTTHPTEFTLFPGTDGSWRIVAIPPKLGDFGQKNPLPQAWAGLSDEELEAVTGISGSVFCHKNRFIAVFKTRSAALAALESHNLLYRS